MDDFVTERRPGGFGGFERTLKHAGLFKEQSYRCLENMCRYTRGTRRNPALSAPTRWSGPSWQRTFRESCFQFSFRSYLSLFKAPSVKKTCKVKDIML